MADLVVFDLFIPWTDDSTGEFHSMAKFDRWELATVQRFGGATLLALRVKGMWVDPDRGTTDSLVRDVNRWYRVGVEPGQVGVMIEWARTTSQTFGQKCLYLQESGTAKLVWSDGRVT